MKTYYLTSTLFEGEIEFKFDEKGYLLGYQNRAQLNDEQHRWLLGQLPRTLDELKNIIKQSTSAKLIEVKQKVTFEMFWSKYDDKLNSSKKRTLTKWNKMPESEQIKAYNYLIMYFTNIPQGTRKKFAETYLNSELWNN